MIKKGICAACGLIMAMAANAQNAYDASIVLGSELNGTARFVGMGGAMGALGGDISTISTNPAGLGIFRSNDFSASFGFQSTGTESSFNGTSMKESNTRASFDQIGFVYSYKVGNNTSLRYVNFGFNYHKSKNFNRLFSMGGMLNGLSQSHQLAQEMEYAGMNSAASFDALLKAENPYRTYWDRYPVLGIMGSMTGVVDFFDGSVLGWDGYSNNYFSQEKGGISDYDFNVSFNIEDRIYLGVTLGMHDLSYDRFTSYTEDLDDDKGQENGGYTLDNYYSLQGTGVDLKLGAILRPFEESPFRLGLAIHTPTWYDLTENYNAVLSSDIFACDEAYSQNLSDFLSLDYLTYDYRMLTPWKFNVSAGTTFSNMFALGAEYEYSDYSSSKLEDIDGFELGGQYNVEQSLKGVHTFRLGMEARLAPQFSVRAGYNYSSALFKDDAYNVLASYRTNTEFNNIKERNTFTLGVGYRGNVVYADLAYKYDMYKSDFYAFDDVQLPATKVDNERHQLMFTLGAKF